MTTHDICLAARNSDCACGAPPGHPCACPPGHYHLARIARAVQRGDLTPADLASVIWGEVFTGMDTITDPGVMPPEIVVDHAFSTPPVGAL